MLLPEFGVKRPITNVMIFFAAIIMGLVSIYFLPIDLMPKIEPPSITVVTVYRGASAEDVETKVTRYIENDLSIIPNLDEIISFSREDMSSVTCKFAWGTDMDEASNNIRARLDFTKKWLPADAQQPTILKFDTSMIPILGVGITGEKGKSWEKLYDLVDTEIGDALKRLPGVGGIQLFGGLQRAIKVDLNRHKMEAYELTPRDIETALKNSNVTIPAGNLKIGQNEYMLRLPGEFQKIGEIGETVIREYRGKVIHLKDVALVTDSFKEVTWDVNVNGAPGVLMTVQKQSGANTVAVAKSVFARLESLKKDLPPDIKMGEMFNTAKYIEQTLSNLTTTVIWGGILVILTTLFFLRNLRGSLIIALTIPFSLIISFIFIYLFGMTINIMSMASVAIAIGMVVDNAIVVLENISYHMSKDKTPFEAAIHGASEVGLAVSASTFTTVVVFVPLIFTKGISGIMFRDLALVVIVVLTASLITSLTLTPMLGSRLFKPARRSSSQADAGGPDSAVTHRPRLYIWSEHIFNTIEENYGKLLGWALGHKFLIIAASLIIFIFSLCLIPLIGSEFFPKEDTGDLWITVELPVGKRIEETMVMGQELQKLFREVAGKEIKDLFIRSGMSEFGSGPMSMKEGSNVVMAGAKLVSVTQRNRSTEDIGQILKDKILKLPGVVKVSVDSGDPLQRILTGGAKPLSIEIIGYDIDATNRLAEEIRQTLLGIKGVSDPSVSRDVAKPEFIINVDEDKSARLGLNKSIIGQTLRTYFHGNDTVKFRAGRKEYDIIIRLQETDRAFLENVRDITIPSPSGRMVPLVNVARIEEGLGPMEIERKNRERIVKVNANVYGRSLGDVARDVEYAVNKLTKPPDVTVNIGGMVKEQRKSFTDMGLLLVLSILLVYMVMASQFESFLHPFVIMFSVPFAFTGVFVALFLFGYHLSLVTILGAILLVGIAVNNAIVLIDYINILRGRGLVLIEAVKEAGSRRLRPILMTSLTTIFGLIPMAFGTGEGSESWRPLGLVILSGLAVSMFISLILVPVIYSLATRNKE